MKTLQSTPKIICVGWHKTGTSTIGKALVALGYDVVGARTDTVEDLYTGNVEKVINLAEKFDVLSDVPWAALYKELDKAFPNSKFILTIRDNEKWLNSAQKHFGSTYCRMHEWIYGKGVLKGNEDLYLKKYQQHNKDVLSYFKNRPDDLLVMNFEKGEGWKKLCSFIEIPVPNQSFPHANKGKHNYNKKDKLIQKLKDLVPNSIRKGVFRTKLFFLKRLGYKDPRNIFNNFPENRIQRAKDKKYWERKGY